MDTLKIIKEGTNKFYHIHNDLEDTKFILSNFTVTLDGNKFKIVENDGAVRFPYLVQNITIIDNTSGGTTFMTSSPMLFWDKLIQIQYTGIPMFAVDGLTSDELDAIHNSESPSAINPFITASQLEASTTPTFSQVLTQGNDAEGQEIILSNIGGDVQKIYATAGEIVIESPAYRVRVAADGGLKVDNGVETKNLRIVNSTDDSKYINIYKNDVDAAYNQQLQSKNGTFAYMDDLQAIQEGLSWKTPALVYITTPISMLGVIPQEAIGTTHQGQTINVGDRVILSAQANPIYNGIYRMYLAGGFQRYARTDDANATAELNNALIPVTSGTYANKTFRQTTPNPTIGTSNIVFSDFGNSVSNATDVVAGIMKLYNSLGSDTDGTINRGALTTLFGLKADKTEIAKCITLSSDISTTSTSAVNTNLSLPIAANEILKFTADLKMGAVTGGYLVQVTLPAGATIQGGSFSAASTSTTARILNLAANTLTLALQTSSGTTGPVILPFTVTNGTTAGNVIISFASAAGSVTTVYAGSSLTQHKTTQV